MDSNTRLVYSTDPQHARHGLILKDRIVAAHLRAVGFKVQLIAPRRWLAPFDARPARDHFERALFAVKKECHVEQFAGREVI